MRRRDFISLCAAAPIRAATALDESAGRILEREAPAGFDYLLWGLTGREPLAQRWNRASAAAPLGSLVKPFLALAFGEQNDFRYPSLTCEPGACWLPSGHGPVSIQSAIAHSCNAYFSRIAAGISPVALEGVARRFGLTPPPEAVPDILIGLHGGWRARPGLIAEAYAELEFRRSDPGVANIVDAMRLCAHAGTASGARARAAAKTGTAVCVHRPGAPGDGLVAALFPETSPRYVLVARGHGMTGAEAARSMRPFFLAMKSAW